jgi:preprotein translocase subunit SecD
MQGPPQPVANNPEAQRYAAENAAFRKQAQELQAKLAEYENAKLSKDQLTEKKLAELQAEHGEYRIKSQQRYITALAQAKAAALGFAHPEVAARLIDPVALELDDDEEPKNLDKLLTKLAETYPELVAQAAPPQGQGQPQGTPRPPVNTGPSTNPGRQTQSGQLQQGQRPLRTFADIEWSR